MLKTVLIVSLIAALLVSVSCSSQSDGGGDNIPNVKNTTTTKYTEITGITTSADNIGDPIPVYEEPETDENGTYLLTKAEDLQWLSNYVNNSNELAGNEFSVKMMNDIDLSEITNWTPIGKDGFSVFKGTFDGNGFSITGLKVKPADLTTDGENYIALFGITHNAIIKNLSVTGFELYGNNFVAGICASNGGVIENCVSDAKIIGNTSLGAVCGFNSGTIVNCTSYGEINGSENMLGGICGYTYGATVSDCKNYAEVLGKTYVGGISGYADKGVIIGCENNAPIIAESYAGGICGRLDALNVYKYVDKKLVCTEIEFENMGIINNCTNKSSVQAHDSYAGGICGYSNAYLSNCLNSGEIRAKNNVGGISAEAHYGALYAVTNAGNVYSSEGYAAGIVAHSRVPVVLADNRASVTAVGDYAAGICVLNADGGIYSCLNSAVVSASDYVSGICVQTQSEIIGCVFVSQTVCAQESQNSASLLVQSIGNDVSVRDCMFFEGSAMLVIPESLDKSFCSVINENDIKSGRVAYMLGTYVEDDILLWGYDFEMSELPQITENDSMRVYCVLRYSSCDMSDVPENVYSNVNKDQVPEHIYENGFCAVCGKNF